MKWKVRILPQALQIAKRENVPDDELHRQVYFLKELAQQHNPATDPRIEDVQSIHKDILRFKENKDAVYRMVFERIVYTEEAQQQSGLNGLLYLLGIYSRDDTTYRRVKQDYYKD